MDAELMKSRIEKAVERYEKAQMRPRKNRNAWSKINRDGKRIAYIKSVTTVTPSSGAR